MELMVSGVELADLGVDRERPHLICLSTPPVRCRQSQVLPSTAELHLPSATFACPCTGSASGRRPADALRAGPGADESGSKAWRA